MRVIKCVVRIARRIRLSMEERELAFMEARAPEFLERQRNVVRALRARVAADRLFNSAEAIARKIERDVKKAGALARAQS